MSSSDPAPASAPDGRVIPVAPREIVDLVTRILRVHGVDPGSASATAQDVMCCQAHGHPAVPIVVAAVADGSIASLRAPHDPPTPDPAVMHDAYRSGIQLAEPVFRALERAAADFLVAENVLDALADEPPAD